MKNKLIVLSVLFGLTTAGLTAQNIGGSVGVRYSLLGFEPSLSLNINDFELEAACPMARMDGIFGWAASVSLGGLSNAFANRGWQNGFGLTYSFIPSVYISSITGTIDEDYQFSFADSLHIATLYYRGQYKFSNGLTLFFRLNLPLVAVYLEEQGIEALSVIDREGGYISILACIYTPSIGIRWMF